MNSLLAVASLFAILIWTELLRRTLTTLKRFPPPEALKPEFQEDLPFVSILVPARNEEGNITRCIESLLKLDYPRYEVIVVNDRSTDGTPVILQRLEKTSDRLRVIDVEESKEGWSGKNYALHVGVAHARGAWVLFTDADTEHELLSLRLGIQEAREHSTGFLSFFSRMDCRGFWEALVQPTASGLVTLWYPMEALNDPACPVGFANGQYLLMSRDVYGRIGGHQTVKDRLLEDVALAEEAKRRGIPFRMAIGTHAIRTRMYRGFRSSWSGWKRIFVHLARRNPVVLLQPALSLCLMGMLPSLAFLCSLAVDAPAWTRLLACFSFLLSIAVWWVFSTLNRQPRWPAVLIPLSAVVVMGVLLSAVWDSLTGKETCWRGVRYY